MAELDKGGTVRLEELVISSLATADALAKLLIEKGITSALEFSKETLSLQILLVFLSTIWLAGLASSQEAPGERMFSPDGKWLYVGNYADRNISVLRVDGDTVINTGKVVSLSGSPASM